MAPAADLFEDAFSCGICYDYFHEPITLSCCGKSFCCSCLQETILNRVKCGGIPRCPAGCNEKLPFKLPRSSQALKAAMEQAVPEEVQRRKEEALEEDSEKVKVCHGGFMPWQVVAAATHIGPPEVCVVSQGTHGIIIGNADDTENVIVKFDKLENGSEHCINVSASALRNPLPGGFQIGSPAASRGDFELDGTVAVHIGDVGIVCGLQGEGYVQVIFAECVAGRDRMMALPIEGMTPHKLLVGGFMLGQKVQACMDIPAIDHTIRAGTQGIVFCENNDALLTVAFDVEGSGKLWAHPRSKGWMDCPGIKFANLYPNAIHAFNDTPPGVVVQAKTDIKDAVGTVVVKVGTPGIVNACMDAMRLVVTFQGSGDQGEPFEKKLIVAPSTLERTTELHEVNAIAC